MWWYSGVLPNRPGPDVYVCMAVWLVTPVSPPYCVVSGCNSGLQQSHSPPPMGGETSSTYYSIYHSTGVVVVKSDTALYFLHRDMFRHEPRYTERLSLLHLGGFL